MKFIFDLDGTLYNFKDSDTFKGSSLSKAIKEKIFLYFSDSLNIPHQDIPIIYKKLKDKYHGHISVGVEKEFGIDRKIYFANTWNLNPANFIEKQSPRKILEPLKNKFAILTEAPMIWTSAVLDYLNIKDLIDDLIFTGDELIRKPSLESFKKVKSMLSDHVIYAVGDQEETDILPAKKIGLKTIRIGSGKTQADHQINNIQELPTVFK